MNKAEIKERVTILVRHTVPESEDLNGDFELLGEGAAFDSVTALELVLSLEKEFGIVVEDGDIKPENLSNLESIIGFVQIAMSRRK